MKNQNQDWLREFNEFMSQDNSQVPDSLTEIVMNKIAKFMNPDPKMIFVKILGIHLVVGFLSLAICHQFEVNPFGTSFSLADILMKWGGHSVCMIFCGFLFTSLSFAAAGYFLTIEEVQVLRRTEALQALALSSLSLGLLAFAGAQLVLTFAGLWLLGALIGGFASIEGSLWLKVRAVKP